MSSFQLDEIDDDLIQIQLSGVAGVSGPFAEPVYVYLVGGSAPALINVGHPSTEEALVAALRECDVSPAQIERIVATSWDPRVIGGVARFPGADLFVLSPDMRAPGDLELVFENQRKRWRGLADEFAAEDSEFSRRTVQDFVQAFFPRVTRDLGFLPLRDGHRLRIGSLDLEVLATGGPGPGHLSLFDEARGLMFTGDFALMGLPDEIEHPRAYLLSLERMAELRPTKVLPNRGQVLPRGRQTLMSAGRFLNTFLTNVPLALVKGPTVLQFLERDRGRLPEDPLELLAAYEVHRMLLDELVRTRTIAAEGDGLHRRYGVDVQDSRQDLR